MNNAYVTLDFIKSADVLDISTTTDADTRLLRLLENISEWTDKWLGRHFYALQQVRTFDGDGKVELFIPDLISLTTLKDDDDQDGTFDVTWAANDFKLWPYNADPTTATNPLSTPFTKIITNIRGGTKTGFPRGRQTVQIDGEWGYWRHLTRATEVVDTGGITSTALTLPVDAKTDIEVGHTLLIESEQMFVTSITGNNLTVRRGVNNTTAAAHLATVVIDIYEYPGAVKEAITITVGRLWKRKESSFANVIGTPDGSVQVFRGMDSDVKMLLQDFKQDSISFIVPQNKVLRNNLTDIDVLRRNSGSLL